MRAMISVVRFGAAPDRNELTTNSVLQSRKKRFLPIRPASQPVAGMTTDLVEARRQRALQVREDHVGDAGVEDLHEGDDHHRERDRPLLSGRHRWGLRCGDRRSHDEGLVVR